ncbi:hypothetical protein LCGC14_1233490 [marine sediment metagenome]|uniref:Uncharacterized protein n=1 Tax=marine sediment metagenome TaxID=412755 RepID=A0A0F9LBZ2_9ZZZZ
MAEVDTSARDAEIARREKADAAEAARIERLKVERIEERDRLSHLPGGKLRLAAEALRFRAAGGESQYETPLGDQITPPPSLITDPTAITLPGDDQASTVGELGQAAVDAEFAAVEAENKAALENQARAAGQAEDITTSRDETTADIDAVREDLDTRQEDFDASIVTQMEDLKNLPAAAITEFEKLRGEFDLIADASFERTEGNRREALAGVMQGRSQAMEAAVQGVQGNINNQIAQIQSNTNLTDSQKQSMIAQVQLAGATSMGPIIGTSVLAFNQLAADVAVSFGEIVGNLEGVGLQVKGQLMGMQGDAFASAQVEVGRMTNQLLDIQAGADAAFANSQGQLLGIRAQAELGNNTLLAELLPALATPYMNFTDAAANAAATAQTIMMDDFQLKLGDDVMQLNIAALREQQGTFGWRIIQGIMEGLSVGGRAGAFLGGVGAVAGESDENPPV